MKWIARLLLVAVILVACASLSTCNTAARQQQRREAWDMYAALVYYIEDHGRFPGSPEDFLRLRGLAYYGTGSFTIAERTGSPFAPYTYGEHVRLAAFDVSWGAPLDRFRLTKKETVVDEADREVWLVRSSNPFMSSAHTAALLRVYREVQQRPATKPVHR